ncbi:MAG: hypothetical protein ACO2OZ_03370 [Acidilobaceae archaeon]|jgi:hypothetical protein
MAWDWYELAEEIAEDLKKWAENEWREHIIKRYNDLAEKVVRFQREYFSDGEFMSLGYAVIHKRGDIIIKALVASGENDVYVEAVDIEEWLREQDP